MTLRAEARRAHLKRSGKTESHRPLTKTLQASDTRRLSFCAASDTAALLILQGLGGTASAPNSLLRHDRRNAGLGETPIELARRNPTAHKRSIMAALPIPNTQQAVQGGGVVPAVRLTHANTDETGTQLATGNTNPLPVTVVGSGGSGSSTVALAPANTAGTGGLTTFKNAALSNTAVAAKASAASLYGYNISNPNASFTYVQFFNVAEGSVTVGTTSNLFAMAVPANGVLDGVFPLGIDFSTALTIAATTAAANGTAPGTALNVNLWYK